MAVIVTFNSDVFSIYQTFYTAKKTDLLESLAWLINDEKNIGTSEEQCTLIKYLAQFYFTVILLVEQTFNPSWTYLDWLTEEEYNTIMNNLFIEGTLPDIINVPGALPSPVPATPSSSVSNLFEATFNTINGTITVVTDITTEPVSISIFDASGIPVIPGIGLGFVPRIDGGVYVFDITSTDAVSGYKLKILY